MSKDYSKLCATEIAAPVKTLPKAAVQLEQVISADDEATIIARLATAYGEMTEDELRALSWTDKVRIAQGKPVEKKGAK